MLLSVTDSPFPSVCLICRNADRIPIQFKMALDAASPTCPHPDDSPAPFKFSIEAPSRRASVCSEYVSSIMRATSPDSSPDTEPDVSPFLAVSDLKQRRHSDNSLQISKNLSSGSSTTSINRPASSLSPQPPISRARSSSSLMNSGSRRRHSSVNPHDIQRFATKLMDSAAESMVESVEKASKVHPSLLFLLFSRLDSLSPACDCMSFLSTNIYPRILSGGRNSRFLLPFFFAPLLPFVLGFSFWIPDVDV